MFSSDEIEQFALVALIALLVLVIQMVVKGMRKKSKRRSAKKNPTVPSDDEEMVVSKQPCDAEYSTANRGYCDEERSNEYLTTTTDSRQGICAPAPKIVINSKSEYAPEQVDEPYTFEGKTPNPRNDERRYLILAKSAYDNLLSSLDWGMRTKRNRVEQGGVLLGRVYKYRNEIYNFVEDILLADTSGNPVFVEFTHSMWAEMQQGLSNKNSCRHTNEQLVIVGWFHTHPNGLSVFMSGTDMTTQRLNFLQEWQASLVMNPHTNNYRVFFGVNAEEGRIVFPKRKSNGSR